MSAFEPIERLEGSDVLVAGGLGAVGRAIARRAALLAAARSEQGAAWRAC
ncbi:MAG TPA: hypothetical protein VLY46_07990 [Usitatibacter sp.]|nr:hypothetical protein [Usitatibacter sp.]